MSNFLEMLACAVLAGFLVCFLHIFLFSDVSPDYQQGYQDGYSEYNYTKYQAAGEICDSSSGYTGTQYNYALGYRHGYISKKDDNVKNETIKILGV